MSRPSAAEFPSSSDQTGWARSGIERFERALDGSRLVCTARDDQDRLVGMGRASSSAAPCTRS